MKREILPIGTTGVATKDMKSEKCTIKKGTKITIIGFEYMYGYDIKDEFGNTIIEAGFDCIIPEGEKKQEQKQIRTISRKKEPITILSIGTTGVATKDIKSENCTIKKGTKITIIGFEYMYGYDIKDEFGNRITEAGFDCIIPDERKKGEPGDMER